MDPIAILTGASSGIGAAAAAQFVEHGYTVINVSRRDCPVPGVETLATDLADEQSASLNLRNAGIEGSGCRRRAGVSGP